jgi:hypothetical protein
MTDSTHRVPRVKALGTWGSPLLKSYSNQSDSIY